MNLNGYTLKAVRMTEVRRGIAYSGDILYNGQRIGEAYNDGDGGMTHVRLSPDHANHYPVLTEDFVERLFSLHDYEEIYTENMGGRTDKGMAFIVYKNPFDLNITVIGEDETIEDFAANLKKTEPELEIESIEVFRSLDAFNIDQDHQPELYKNPAFTNDEEKMDSGIQMS